MTFTIWKRVKTYPPREQAIAELFSLGAVQTSHPDFVGDPPPATYVSPEYRIEEDSE